MALVLADDRRDGKVEKLGPGGVEAVHGLDEPELGDLVEVLVGLLRAGITARTGPRERHVALDQLVT